MVPRSFFARPSLEVARALIGMRLVRDDVVVRITEVEAYGGPADSASHARHGRTTRNAPIWGPPGHVYMYLCYGLHQMLNLVAGARAGDGHAILVRGGEVLAGLDTVLARRRASAASPALLAGPGKLAQGLGLDLAFSHHDVCAPGGLELHEGDGVVRVLAGPRVGIDFAAPRDRRAPLRFALAGSGAVTELATLAAPRRAGRARTPRRPA
ncbi:MAG: DNA-3-methyladenine glycosylase [Deltaproteobacteria bacterium]|nr:DNA-3-methyladenine glycosylase [Deltaproteobacteria bacterium]